MVWDLLYFNKCRLAVGGPWGLAVGGWQRLAAVGRLAVGSGWAVGGWQRLAAVGGWQRLGGWRLAAVGSGWAVGGWQRLGGWRLMIPRGRPEGTSFPQRNPATQRRPWPRGRTVSGWAPRGGSRGPPGRGTWSSSARETPAAPLASAAGRRCAPS